MGSPDTVPAILSPYSKEFRVWECDGRIYKQHDLVPSVGMVSTYAVLLVSADPEAHPRFLTVQENRITNLMAHQPIDGASVFDPMGKYLGRGGEPLEPPGRPDTPPVSMVELAKRSGVLGAVEQETLEPTRTFLEAPPEGDGEDEGVACHLHRFWLREDLEVKMKLPLDLTDEEAERFAVFVTTLPLAGRKEG